MSRVDRNDPQIEREQDFSIGRPAPASMIRPSSRVAKILTKSSEPHEPKRHQAQTYFRNPVRSPEPKKGSPNREPRPSPVSRDFGETNQDRLDDQRLLKQYLNEKKLSQRADKHSHQTENQIQEGALNLVNIVLFFFLVLFINMIPGFSFGRSSIIFYIGAWFLARTLAKKIINRS